ncbi:MAG: hypothetical protein R3C49_09515 [Planctomycetaceae bacterium]
MVFALGLIIGAGAMSLLPQKPVHASSANSNDKFSMATVPVSGNSYDTEAVFVLDHLTGVLRGGILNTQTGDFGYTFLHSVAADFQVNPATPEPKYSIVGGPATVRGGGNVQPANGVVYVAELTSGLVICYGFPLPRGRGQLEPLPLVRMAAFNFREAVGG